MINQKILISIVLAVVVIGAGYLVVKSSMRVTEDVTVTSSNPNPADNAKENTDVGYVSGRVTIGPSCPGPEREDKPCITPPEAYTSREAVVYASNGSTVKERINLSTEGNYKIALAPGSYFIQIVPAGIGPGEKKSFTIKASQTTTINFDIDTGIR